MVSMDSQPPRRQTVTGTVTYVAELGMASAFRLDVVAGDGSLAAGSSRTLTVRLDDTGTRTWLVEHQAPALVDLTLVWLRDDEEYGTGDITGVVDPTRTSWRLESLAVSDRQAST